MSDSSVPSPKPVSVVTVLAVLGLFALFLLAVRLAYLPKADTDVGYAAEKVPDDLKWKTSIEGRKEVLTELRVSNQKAATTYAWIDQKAGVVQLPIDRAVELTVQRYGAKK